MKSNWITVIILLLAVVVAVFGLASILKLVENVEKSFSSDDVDDSSDGNINVPGGSTNAPDDTGNFDDDTENSGDGNGSLGDDDVAETTMIEMYSVPDFGYDINQPDATDLYGVRFQAKISDYLKSSVIDVGLGEVKWLYTPLDQIESAGLLNETNIDWVACLEAANVQYMIKDKLEHAFENKTSDGNWIARFRFNNIMYNNINRPFFAIAYVEHNNGTRQYAAFPKGETVTTLSRSFGYVCVEALNRSSHSEEAFWPSEVDSNLLNFVSLSAGKAFGYDNADAASKGLKYYPIFEANGTYGQNLKIDLTVGGNSYRYDIKTGIYGSDGAFIDCKMPFVCYTTNESVAVVENGCIKPVGTGTCKIWFYCGLGSCSIDVTVT